MRVMLAESGSGDHQTRIRASGVLAPRAPVLLRPLRCKRISRIFLRLIIISYQRLHRRLSHVFFSPSPLHSTV